MVYVAIIYLYTFKKCTRSYVYKWKNIAGDNFTLRKCPNFNAGSIFFSGAFIKKFFVLSEEAE